MIESAYLLWTVLAFISMLLGLLMGASSGSIPYIFPLMAMVFFAVSGAGSVNIEVPFAIFNETTDLDDANIVTGDIVHKNSWQLWLLHGALVLVNFAMLFQGVMDRIVESLQGQKFGGGRET